MNYQLIPQRLTMIRAPSGVVTRRQKWLVADEEGEIVTTEAGRYTSGYKARYEMAVEESTLLKELRLAFRGYIITSCPDPLSFPDNRARFEARIEKPVRRTVAVEPIGNPQNTTTPVLASQGQIF